MNEYDEIEELINRAKSLVQSQKKGPKNRANSDIFIYQNRPVHTTDWSKERDVTYISIYLPTRIPDFKEYPCKSIVLHSHTVFQPCDRNRYCHVLGWNVPDNYIYEFHNVWGYLYNPGEPSYLKLGVDLSI